MWFWLLLTAWVVAFVAWFLTAPTRVGADEPAPVPVSPCVNTGHAYRAQPTVWRCVNCSDERISEGVYDQEHAA